MTCGVLLDLAGVVYDGEKAVPGALDAIKRLRAAGLPVRLVSNTTRSTKASVLERLRGFGLDVGEDEAFTPARAAVGWLKANRRSPHLLIHPGLEADFSDLPPGQGRAVVVGDAGAAFDYAALNAAFRALSAGADFLALAANRSFRDADGELSLDAGPFVAALEFAAGRKARVLGKPSPEFFRAALASMDILAAEAVMIGDDAESDVAGALSAGVGQGILVRTGKYRPGDETRFSPPPNSVADDLAQAVDQLLAQTQ
ncbi:TIGR01458 family HAD-type hydrolase [Mesorhizobium xinjiangense]|uniref:TIGR01458 family HAD-type hydrolase n=1 Tax=Mesorhizobium xinjiangense TaxID=2678685 RepID=UPI0012ED06E1|nr:TIGR01458 family HAD-type hydrolase [Mesorhizobium xinjiangense]